MKASIAIRLVPALTLLVLISVQAWGQNVATLEGRVTDPAGAVVPGVEITLTDTATGATRTTTTNADGTYSFAPEPIRFGPRSKVSRRSCRRTCNSWWRQPRDWTLSYSSALWPNK